MKRSKGEIEARAFEAALAGGMASGRYRLRLYVSGSTPRSLRAIRNIREICEKELHGRCDLEVIDVYQHPESIAPEQVVVTPTLIRQLPEPLRKIIGDLSDAERVRVGLDLLSPKGGHEG